MKIIVCIKQIPDTKDVRWTKDNNIIREGLISILNPYDLYAILFAKKIKEQIKNTEITLLSMGPNSASDSIEYGLAFNCDRGILLSDKRFSGADTLATAKTLKYAILNNIKTYDLILTGQFALDGDTAQTSYNLANLLKIPHIGYVQDFEEIKENELVVKSVKDNGIYKIKTKTPVVISISAFKDEIYIPKAIDYINAQKKEIQILSSADINANLDEVGIKGSPTYVFKAFRPENKRECVFKNDLIGELN